MEPAVDYNIYKSRFITGQKRPSRAVAEVCLRDETLRQFWQNAIRAIRNDPLGEIDGEVFTSDYLGVYLGPYDVEVKHHYRWIDKQGGDSYMDIWEECAELEESFEVVSARDVDYDVTLPGLVAAINRFYEKNKLRLH